MLPGKWASAVLDVLDRASIPESKVAAQLGVARATTYRYLHGTRSVSETLVLQINKAVAILTGIPEVAGYLTSIAIVEGLIAGDEADAQSLVGFAAALSVTKMFLRDEALEEIVLQVKSLEPIRQRKLFTDLNYVVRKNIARRIAGLSTLTTYEQVCAVFQKHRLDILAWQLPPRRIDQAVSLQKFVSAVRVILAESIPDAATRSRTENRILEEYGKDLKSSQDSVFSLLEDMENGIRTAFEKLLVELKALASPNVRSNKLQDLIDEIAAFVESKKIIK